MTAPLVIARPGKVGGPCRRMHCNSETCAAWRREAETLCSICNEPIGYDTRYLNETGDEEFAQLVLTHEICAAAREARSPTT